MNWKKALVCLLCSAVVLFSVNLPGAYAAGSDTIIFLALNDNLVTSPSVENMPIAVGGTVYVPYTMFDANITGNSLGVIVGAVNNVVTVFNKQKVLTYDLNANTCYDRNGNSYTRAIMRNGIIYLPLVSLCNYFGREVINNYQRDMGCLLYTSFHGGFILLGRSGSEGVCGCRSGARQRVRSGALSPSPGSGVSVPSPRTAAHNSSGLGQTGGTARAVSLRHGPVN